MNNNQFDLFGFDVTQFAPQKLPVTEAPVMMSLIGIGIKQDISGVCEFCRTGWEMHGSGILPVPGIGDHISLDIERRFSLTHPEHGRVETKIKNVALIVTNVLWFYGTITTVYIFTGPQKLLIGKQTN